MLYQLSLCPPYLTSACLLGRKILTFSSHLKILSVPYHILSKILWDVTWRIFQSYLAHFFAVDGHTHILTTYTNGTSELTVTFLFFSPQSVVMLVFREEKTPEDEIKAWQFWHSRQHSVKQRILDVGEYGWYK